MLFQNTDFTRKELEFIIENSMQLISNGTITGINLISSENKPLPDSRIIVHYLQDSDEQISEIEKTISDLFPNIETMVVPRYTFYILDEKYIQKPNFKQEYNKAKFLNKKLNEIDIKNVIEYPKEYILCNQEKDLLIYNFDNTKLNDLASNILSADQEGPAPWIHPAVIVKDNGLIRNIPGYVKKDYTSIISKNSEFYSVIYNKKKKRFLKDYLKKLCANLPSEDIKINHSSILISKAFINKQLNDYMKENSTNLL